MRGDKTMDLPVCVASAFSLSFYYQLFITFFITFIVINLFAVFCFSYLKLYTTMPISKLAAFLDMDEDTFRTQLLCYKVSTS